MCGWAVGGGHIPRYLGVARLHVDYLRDRVWAAGEGGREAHRGAQLAQDRTAWAGGWAARRGGCFISMGFSQDSHLRLHLPWYLVFVFLMPLPPPSLPPFLLMTSANALTATMTMTMTMACTVAGQPDLCATCLSLINVFRAAVAPGLAPGLVV